MTGGDLGTISGEGEIGIGTEVSGDLLRLKFVDVQPVRHQGCVLQFEEVLDLIPGPGLRGSWADRRGLGLGAQIGGTESDSQDQVE